MGVASHHVVRRHAGFARGADGGDGLEAHRLPLAEGPRGVRAPRPRKCSYAKSRPCRHAARTTTPLPVRAPCTEEPAPTHQASAAPGRDFKLGASREGRDAHEASARPHQTRRVRNSFSRLHAAPAPSALVPSSAPPSASRLPQPLCAPQPPPAAPRALAVAHWLVVVRDSRSAGRGWSALLSRRVLCGALKPRHAITRPPVAFAEGLAVHWCQPFLHPFAGHLPQPEQEMSHRYVDISLVRDCGRRRQQSPEIETQQRGHSPMCRPEQPCPRQDER
jgi:hypothetical protein